MPSITNSFFLFGPRGSGKTTFLKSFFKDFNVYWIDLLDYEAEDKYSRNPDILLDEVKASLCEWVVIDEVQKVSKLLDIVHKIIEDKSIKVKFALTGSSARKLKRGSANLLAGRAFMNHLFPITILELPDLDLLHALKWGTLPKTFSLDSDEDKMSYLRTYALTYLNEEIKAEQIVRKLDPFRKFLEVAAQQNGEIINYSKIGKQIGVDTKTVQSYFHVLEDTLIGFYLKPYHTSIRKRLIESPKFYLFDLGVKRALDRTLKVELVSSTYAFGNAFEHFLITQIYFLNEYYKCDWRFSYLKTADGVELDLIIDRPDNSLVIIEIKSYEEHDQKDINKLKIFKDDLGNTDAYLLYRGKSQLNVDGVEILPWKMAITKLLKNG